MFLVTPQARPKIPQAKGLQGAHGSDAAIGVAAHDAVRDAGLGRPRHEGLGPCPQARCLVVWGFGGLVVLRLGGLEV